MDDSMSRRNVLTGAAALAIPAIEGTAMAKTSAHSILGRSDGRWLNEPKSWSVDEHGELSVATDEGTDFWRSTHYGFIRDSGHFLGFTAPGAFTAQLRIRGNFEKLYDQAGIMVRAMLSSVLTSGQSDWATGPYEFDARDFWMRATVAKGVLRLQVSADGKTWPLVRLAPFPVASSYLVGPMTCTPQRSGLAIRFSDLRISEPTGKDLHDLS